MKTESLTELESAIYKHAYDAGVAHEKQAWLRHIRCHTCGGIKINQLSDTCGDCMEKE